MRVAFTLFLVVLLQAFSAGAAQLSGSETAGEFFDKVAGALLKEELGLELHHIPIYPTNRYSQEVHRLLQVTANLYDSTTNRGNSYPWFPTCFRPRFATNESEIFIAGYVEEAGVSFSERRWHEVEDPNDRPIEPDDNVYGIPIILGAKKGFPNFNEFVVQSAVQFTRKLQLRKGSAFGPVTETNQMLIVGISNTVALELWNPWNNDYPRELTIKVGIRSTCTFTNENELALTNIALHGTNIVLPPGGFQSKQYHVPVLATDIALTNSVLRSSPQQHFDPISSTNFFESVAGFPTNVWGLETKTRAILLITDGEHLVDFVALSDLRTALDVSAELARESGPYSFWSVTPAGGANLGVCNQLRVSLGELYTGNWGNYQIGPPPDQNDAIEQFQRFVYGITNIAVMDAPFTPTAKIVQATSWEVNDPFLHQTAQQLLGGRTNPFTTTINLRPPRAPITVTNNSTLGRISRSYFPWGAYRDIDPASLNFKLRDPGLYSVDWWPAEFSSSLSLATVGRVHRGTPWQSIYLKSGIVPPDEWLVWYGSPSGHPTNDWQLVSVLASMLNTNAPESLLSINSTNRAAWAMAFEGLLATTNDEECTYFNFTVHSNSPQVSVVLDGIEASRATLSGGYFDHLGAVLATPELSMASFPWMNFAWWWIDCLPDAALEMIPSQLLPKLRPDPVANFAQFSGPFQINFRVIPGRTYEIEASDDLQHWQSISTNFVAESSFAFAESANFNRRFYRLKLVP